MNHTIDAGNEFKLNRWQHTPTADIQAARMFSISKPSRARQEQQEPHARIFL